MALPHMQRLNRPSTTPTVDANYYVRVANDTNKQRQWNSAKCMARSVDAYKESYMPNTKGEKLAGRRKELAHLLQQENMEYQAELHSKRLHTGITGDMTDRIGYLREQKEIQRKKNELPARRHKVVAQEVIEDKKETEAMEWEESVFDFDDNDDPDMCGEYCRDVFRNETTKREPKWVMEGRLTEKQSRMRLICIDWLTNVSHSWSLATDTIFVATLYFDKVIRLGKWTIQDLQPVAGACLFIAAKVEEVHAVPIGDIIEITPESSLEIMKAYEKQILIYLDYEMTAPHVMLFIRRFNSISKADMKTHIITKYLATLCLRHKGHCSKPQSMLAAAIVFLSRCLTGLSEAEAWTQSQITYSGYTIDQVKPLVCFVSHVLSTANRYASLHRGNMEKAAVAFKVYSSGTQRGISVDACMKASLVEKYSFMNSIQLETY